MKRFPIARYGGMLLCAELLPVEAVRLFDANVPPDVAPLYFHRAFSILRELRKFDMKADAIQNQICISCSEISAQVQNVILRPVYCCRVLNATNCPCAV